MVVSTVATAAMITDPGAIVMWAAILALMAAEFVVLLLLVMGGAAKDGD